MDPAELERIVARALGTLPSPRAPRSLLPRVMAAVRLEVSPWYSRAWLAWPRVWQAASLAALCLLVIGVVKLPAASVALLEVLRSNGLIHAPSGLPDILAQATSFWEATQVVWRVVVEPVLGYLCAFILLMTAACVVFGTALNRVALGGASDI